MKPDYFVFYVNNNGSSGYFSSDNKLDAISDLNEIKNFCRTVKILEESTGKTIKEYMSKAKKQINEAPSYYLNDRGWEHKILVGRYNIPKMLEWMVNQWGYEAKYDKDKNIKFYDKGEHFATFFNERTAGEPVLEHDGTVNDRSYKRTEKKTESINEAGTVSGAIGADDGPSFMYPTHDTYRKASTKDLKKYIETGWNIVSHMMDDDTEEEMMARIYPDGPVGSVSFFPAGDIDDLTPNNQENLFGSEAYDKWKKHTLDTIAKVGWEWIKTKGDAEDEEASVKDAEEAEKEAEEQEKEEEEWKKKIEETVNLIEKSMEILEESDDINESKNSDLLFLIDQLSNSMEYYDKQSFVDHIYRETDYDKEKLRNIYDAYWDMPANVRMRMNMIKDWEGWLEKFELNESVDEELNERTLHRPTKDELMRVKQGATIVADFRGMGKLSYKVLSKNNKELKLKGFDGKKYKLPYSEYDSVDKIRESVDTVNERMRGAELDQSAVKKMYRNASSSEKKVFDKAVKAYNNGNFYRNYSLMDELDEVLYAYHYDIFPTATDDIVTIDDDTMVDIIDVLSTVAESVNEAASKKFSQAAEEYQRESVKLQDLKEKQQKLVKKFKNSKGKDKEKLKDALIKMHREVKKQQSIVDRAEKSFENAIRNEPEDLEEAVNLMFERLSLSAKNPEQKKAILSLLPVNLEDYSKYKPEFIDMLNKFYKSHGIPAEIKEGRWSQGFGGRSEYDDVVQGDVFDKWRKKMKDVIDDKNLSRKAYNDYIKKIKNASSTSDTKKITKQIKNIVEAKDLSAREVEKKFSKGDTVKFKGPNGVVTDTIEKVDGIYLKLKKSGTIPYQGVIDEASSKPAGRRKVVDWIETFNNAVVVGVRQGFIKFKATNFAVKGIKRELQNMGVDPNLITQLATNEYAINMDDRKNYLEFLTQLNNLNEGFDSYAIIDDLKNMKGVSDIKKGTMAGSKYVTFNADDKMGDELERRFGDRVKYISTRKWGIKLENINEDCGCNKKTINEGVGVMKKDGNTLYVDTDFVQNSQKAGTLKHVSMGDFELRLDNGGTIEFNRASKSFPSFSGRAHRVKGDEKDIKTMLRAMPKGITQESINEEAPCWDGYVQLGMKEKDGKKVPNCVPEENVKEALKEGIIDKIKSLFKKSKNKKDFKKKVKDAGLKRALKQFDFDNDDFKADWFDSDLMDGKIQEYASDLGVFTGKEDELERQIKMRAQSIGKKKLTDKDIDNWLSSMGNLNNYGKDTVKNLKKAITKMNESLNEAMFRVTTVFWGDEYQQIVHAKDEREARKKVEDEFLNAPGAISTTIKGVKKLSEGGNMRDDVKKVLDKVTKAYKVEDDGVLRFSSAKDARKAYKELNRAGIAASPSFESSKNRFFVYLESTQFGKLKELLSEKKDVKTISKKKWDKLHRDYKGEKDGQKYIVTQDKKTRGTVRIPVKVESINENIEVTDERIYNKGKGIIIMLDKNGKKTSAIFKDKKNADKFNRNKQSDLEKLYKIASNTKFPNAIDESINEARRIELGAVYGSLDKQGDGSKAGHKMQILRKRSDGTYKVKHWFARSGKTMTKYHDEKEVRKWIKKLEETSEGLNEANDNIQRGSLVHVPAKNKSGVVLKVYGRKVHVKFADDSEKTFNANELDVIEESKINEAVQPSDTIQKVLDIVKNKQHDKIGNVRMDLTTAGIIKQIWDKVDDSKKKKLNQLKPKALAGLAYKMTK